MKSNNKNKTENKTLDNSGTTLIPWHPAFVEALQLELEDYKDVLEFHSELQLTTEPLRIDCVVIKKMKEVKIEKNIGRIFRTWNLIEYKSPDDYVSIDDFYKVYGYACIYTSLNQIPITDLTITFVESHYPRELIRHLKNTRKYTVEKTSPGVYTVSGDILPIQIIDNRQLSAEDNVWLKNLSNKLNRSDIEQISIRIAQQGKSARIDAYAYAIVYGHFKKMEEKNMAAGVSLEFKQVFYKKLAEVGIITEQQAENEIINAKNKIIIAENEAIIAEKDAEIARKDAEIARLRAEQKKQ